jgi:hypothetical protein
MDSSLFTLHSSLFSLRGEREGVTPPPGSRLSRRARGNSGRAYAMFDRRDGLGPQARPPACRRSEPSAQALERSLANCGAVAVFLGAEGLGPWQQRERILRLTVRDGSPASQSPADPALDFLKLNTWVDLSGGAANDAAIAALVAASSAPNRNDTMMGKCGADRCGS